MRIFKYLLRVALLSVVAAYFLAAIGLLVARYWVLPQVDRWRPEIEALVSREVGAKVEVGSIQAQWYGLNAALVLKDISVADDFGVTRLAIPEVDAILSWRSIFHGAVLFRYLAVEGIALTVHRQTDGSIRVAGFDLPASKRSITLDDALALPAMRWLLRQGRVNLKDATVIWVDQMRGAAPFALRHVSMTLDNELLSHRLGVVATLPPHVGRQVELSARFDRKVSSIIDLLESKDNGEIFLSLPEVRPSNLAPWLDGAALSGIGGSYAMRGWTTLRRGQFAHSTIDLAGSEVLVDGEQAGELLWGADTVRLRLNGSLAILITDQPMAPMFKALANRDRLALQLEAHGAWFQKPVPGMSDVTIDDLKVSLVATHGGESGLMMSLDSLEAANADGLLAARGRWFKAPGDALGQLNLRGTLARFDLKALHRYLPDAVGSEAREWLNDAFRAGIVPQAAFEVAGPLDQFPYGQGQGPGVFRVEGAFQDWAIHYAPDWPDLVDMNGTFSLDRDRVRAQASSGALAAPDGRRMALDRLTAELSSLSTTPRLSLQGITRGAADLYLGMIQQTALQGLAPAFVKDIRAEGDWSMPLKLTVDLDRIDELQFKAELNPNGARLRYRDLPGLEAIKGVAVFTETGFFSPGLQANFLGGTVAVSGGFDGQHTELVVNGTAPWKELARQARSEFLATTFSGQLPYSASLKLQHDAGFVVQARSNLRGTAIALPVPLGKPSNRDLNAELMWQRQGKAGVVLPDTLTFGLGNVLLAVARTNLKPSRTNPAYFDAVAIGVGAKPPALVPGVRVHASLASIKGEEWSEALGAVMKDVAAPSHGPPLFPALTQADLAAQSFSWGGATLDNLSSRFTVTGADQYAVALRSVQTEGDVRWRMRAGKVDGPIVAQFSRLNFGGGSSGHPANAGLTTMGLPEKGTLSELPRLDLSVERFSLHGANLGALRLVGENSADGGRWNISRLQITNPSAELQATGFCRFDDAPGVSLNAKLTIQDLGQLTAFMGQGDQVRKGQGEVTADVVWAEFPWRFSYENLSGRAKLDLKEGVFDHVSSRSARVLEILSLQSFNRLFSVNVNPDETFSKGFPWNSIQGNFAINNGVVDTQDLAINSPVATISMKGGSSLVSETWNLEAEVRPNLDLSGTAVATGFIVNPLVGLGALVGQYLLRKPVEAALSSRYKVNGTWDHPKIEPATPAPPPPPRGSDSTLPSQSLTGS